MPARERKLRPRLVSRVDAVPEQLAQWFRGEIDTTWYEILPYERELLGVRWRAFAAQNPGAKPPRGFQWLSDPLAPEQPTEAQIREARRMLARVK
jgi:hypothetical protein